MRAALSSSRPHRAALAGPAPLPTGDAAAFEVERVVNNSGLVGLGGHLVLAAEILGCRSVGIRIDDEALSFFDPSSRELLRVRPNPLSSQEVRRLRGLRPAGPPPSPGIEPVRAQLRIVRPDGQPGQIRHGQVRKHRLDPRPGDQQMNTEGGVVLLHPRLSNAPQSSRSSRRSV